LAPPHEIMGGCWYLAVDTLSTLLGSLPLLSSHAFTMGSGVLDFFVKKIPFFLTHSLVICFLLVTHLSNRKALTIFQALKAMCN
jgi:hypothetical protein